MGQSRFTIISTWNRVYFFILTIGHFLSLLLEREEGRERNTSVTKKIFNFFSVYIYIFLLFKNYCSSTAPLSRHHFPPPYPPPPPTLNPNPLWLCPWVLYTCSLMTLPLLSPVITLPLPLWLLSVCSLFQCPWLYITWKVMFYIFFPYSQ